MATNKEEITKRTVDAAIGEAKEAAIAAAKEGKEAKAVWKWCKGFGIRATASDEATFYYQRWVGGRGGHSERVKIGAYGPWTVEKAQKRANELSCEYDKAAQSQEGEKPLPTPAERQKAERQRNADKDRIKREGEAVADAWTAYAAMAPFKAQRTAAESSRLVKKLTHTEGKLTDFGRLPLALVTEARLAEVMKPLTPNIFRTTRTALRGFFGWACDHGKDGGKRLTDNPMAGIAKPKGANGKRRRYLNEGEIRAFWLACAQMKWPFGYLFQMLLLLAVRRDEGANMRWSQIKLFHSADGSEAGVWTIPASLAKNGLEHMVYLPAQVIGILKAVRKWRKEGQDLVFSFNGERQVSGFSNAKDRLDERMAAQLGWTLIEDKLAADDEKAWTLHDLRRTARTHWSRLGILEEVREALLLHVKKDLEGRYDLWDFWPERMAASKRWADEIDRLVRNDGQHDAGAGEGFKPVYQDADAFFDEAPDNVIRFTAAHVT
jgi:integrase